MSKFTTAPREQEHHIDQSDADTVMRMAVKEYLPVLRDFDARGGLSLRTIRSGYSLTLKGIEINLGHLESRLFDLDTMEIDATTFRRSVLTEATSAVTRYRGELPFNAVPTLYEAVRH